MSSSGRYSVDMPSNIQEMEYEALSWNVSWSGEGRGVSLRLIHSCLVAISVLMSIAMIYSTVRLSSSFLRVTNATEEHLELEEAALELVEASDYLTECAQRFSATGDRRFLDGYFEEALESRRREEAIERMGVNPMADDALRRLQDVLGESISLMDLEYYSMRLVVEAQGISGYPEQVRDVELSDEDAALAPSDKMAKAAETLLGDEYYEQKDRIREGMQASLDELEKLTRSIDSAELAELHRELNIVRGITVLLILTILFMVWLTSYLGINPVLRAVDRIKADSPIPEIGANEFRYLVQAYNKMYAVYRNSIERLNFKASHDELTGAYNRTGYDLLLSSIDLESTYMMLVDVDDFKSINDTYGHEVGDKALKRLVQVLKGSFRADDLVCRVGGDEFVVLMVHAAAMQKSRIAAKIEHINEQLKNPTDDLPPFSVSVGVVYGKDAEDAKGLYEKTDAAMYESKRRGKHTYTFS